MSERLLLYFYLALKRTIDPYFKKKKIQTGKANDERTISSKITYQFLHLYYQSLSDSCPNLSLCLVPFLTACVLPRAALHPLQVLSLFYFTVVCSKMSPRQLDGSLGS